jgi:hypothetical protein
MNSKEDTQLQSSSAPHASAATQRRQDANRNSPSCEHVHWVCLPVYGLRAFNHQQTASLAKRVAGRGGAARANKILGIFIDQLRDCLANLLAAHQIKQSRD